MQGRKSTMDSDISIAVGYRSAAAARRDLSCDGPSSQSNQRGFRFVRRKISGGKRQIVVSGQTPNSMEGLCLRCPYSIFPKYIARVTQKFYFYDICWESVLLYQAAVRRIASGR